ncbi:TRAP transporter small permease [Elioraea sp.]|uniref:TRAP transporter small permease n=1 Tax=Elioraea sp. TaxID=2185103 RepID=UPI0025C031E6|nr:TRAP transporter small permease [Elioraea sp.]
MAEPPPPPSFLHRADRAFIALNQAVLAALLAAMAALVFANVVARYLFNASFGWVEELTRYMMIWLAYLGAGLALRHGNHVAVMLLVDALPRTPALLLRGLVGLVLAGFVAALAWIGWEYADFAMRQRTPVLQWPTGYVYLAIPIGCVLMAAHLLLSFRSFAEGRADLALRGPDSAT